MTSLLLPEQTMYFDVFDINEMEWTRVKVQLPYIFHRHFADLNEWIDKTNEFIKHNSLDECFFFKIVLYENVYWYRYEHLGALRDAIEQEFWKQLFKAVER